MNIVNSAIIFLKDVRTELKKTSFPSRKLTFRNTVLVIIFSLAMALFLGVLDTLFSYLLNTYVI